MANNDKGKALFTGTDQSSEKMWAKVLLNDEVFKEVLVEFGDEVIAKHGSYKNIGNGMIEFILEWLWGKPYNEFPMGVSGAISIHTPRSGSGTANDMVLKIKGGGLQKKGKLLAPTHNPSTMTTKKRMEGLLGVEGRDRESKSLRMLAC